MIVENRKDSLDDDLYFTCYLIEIIGRDRRLERKDVVNTIGADGLRTIYNDAPILHCLSPERNVGEQCELFNIPYGTFDNLDKCSWTKPSATGIGRLYASICAYAFKTRNDQGADLLQTVVEVYNSFLDEVISDYTSPTYWQGYDYFYRCWDDQSLD